MLELVISLIAGALGGTGAGRMLKDLDLGTAGNAIAGILGGGLGGQLLSMLTGGAVPADAGAAVAGGGLDIGTIVQQVAGGGVGGAVLMAIVGLLKKQFAR
jgi:hypothetical protein